MRHETRTRKQIDADRLDWEAFRLVTSLERFAADYRVPSVDEMAGTLTAMRARIRAHMHKDDVKRTD